MKQSCRNYSCWYMYLWPLDKTLCTSSAITWLLWNMAETWHDNFSWQLIEKIAHVSWHEMKIQSHQVTAWYREAYMGTLYTVTPYCWCINDSILADMSHQLNVYGGSLEPGMSRIKVLQGMEDLRLFQACFHPLLFNHKNVIYFEFFDFSSL